VARLQRRQNLRVRELDALAVAGRGVAVERKGLAAGELDGAMLEIAEPELWALQVGQNADGAVAFRLDAADDLHQLAHPCVRGVAHVDAKNVRAGAEQLFDRFRGV
jgi:hypothetical protein